MEDRRKRLREWMEKKHVDYCLFMTEDPHMSEYINDYYKVREYFSGFSGSNGNLLLGKETGYLWTDGRYFVQAEKELDGSGITLMKMGQKDVPTLEKFLEETLCSGEVLAMDGRLISAVHGLKLQEICEKKNVILKSDFVVDDALWPDRPRDSEEPVWILKESFAGKLALEKIKDIYAEMGKNSVTDFVLSKLDDLMWVFNLRGSDIACNPVAYAFAHFSKEETTLFIKENSVSCEVREYCQENHIQLESYEKVYEILQQKIRGKERKIWVDKNNTAYFMLNFLAKKGALFYGSNPTEIWKSVKNATEQKHIRDVYLKDSIVLTKFIYWLKTSVGKQRITECSAARELDGRRKEVDCFLDFSFPTISAYGENAAMMHYEAKEEDGVVLENKGIYLVDSGGQYEGGTTDVTRSIVMGELPYDIKKQFTLVSMGMLRLQNSVFLKGCTGRNLDILAREPLWQNQTDYKCGTGHGIGYMLNVHEGPQNISWQYRQERKETAILPGMLVSDEPGVYVKGSHGIRTENILLCKEIGENDDGMFLGFEPLTLVPIDLDGILPEIMDKQDKDNWNRYHKLVLETIYPYLTEEEKIWLKNVTKPI